MQEYRRLALSILARAIKDWTQYAYKKHTKRPAYLSVLDDTERFPPCFYRPEVEMEAFFYSQWYWDVCEAAGVDAVAILDRLGIPRK